MGAEEDDNDPLPSDSVEFERWIRKKEVLGRGLEVCLPYHP